MLLLSSKYNIEQADFTDCIFFQPSTLIEEISPYPEALSSAQIPKALNQHGIVEKTKKLFRYECFNIADCIA